MKSTEFIDMDPTGRGPCRLAHLEKNLCPMGSMLLILVLFWAASGCSGSVTHAGFDGIEITTVESPAGKESGQPNLAASADGSIYLSWLQPVSSGGHALYFSRWKAASWGAPKVIAQGTEWFVNWADFPSLVALPQGRLAAHWLVKSGSSPYAYDIFIARSADDGETWGAPERLHRDRTAAEHGFVSLFPWNASEIGAVWIDGRAMGESEQTGSMQLRFRTIGKNGISESSTLLDKRTCACCQTAAAVTSDGIVVAYRDRDLKEIRDISVVRFTQGEWWRPQVLHPDGWQIAGCPVNGPAVAALERQVVVAWFTEGGGRPRVLAAFSDDSGANFVPPLEVATGNPLGRVAVQFLADGRALVGWLEATGGKAEIMVRQVDAKGGMSRAVTVSPSDAARSSGFPRMIRAGNEVIFAWNSVSAGVQTARMSFITQGK